MCARRGAVCRVGAGCVSNGSTEADAGNAVACLLTHTETHATLDPPPPTPNPTPRAPHQLFLVLLHVVISHDRQDEVQKEHEADYHDDERIEGAPAHRRLHQLPRGLQGHDTSACHVSMPSQHVMHYNWVWERRVSLPRRIARVMNLEENGENWQNIRDWPKPSGLTPPPSPTPTMPMTWKSICRKELRMAFQRCGTRRRAPFTQVPMPPPPNPPPSTHPPPPPPTPHAASCICRAQMTPLHEPHEEQ